jgi:serine O-acetyltransferase
MRLFESASADLRRAYALLRGPRLYRALNCARSPGLQAVLVYRLGHWLRHRAPLAARLVLEPAYYVLNALVHVLWGIELPREARIGPGLYIGHFGGIAVSPRAVIGRDCNLSQDVTIGMEGRGERAGAPVIGDEVYIGPGARIFGRIRIGDNVKIGANAVVRRDVPSNAVVALDPGFRIISLEGNRHPPADRAA